MKISVALAAYNGEKYIGEQIESILPQLGRDDEIVVSDDNPAGKTRAAVEFYSAYDGRVRYVEGTGEGVCRNFENAILNCSGDVIFLCDQDDVWLPNKVERVMKAIENGADVVLHDAMMTDGELNVTDAFRRDFEPAFMPFPKNLSMHDWWIGLNAELKGKVEFIYEPLIKHRCHGGNVTGGKTTAAQKISWRIQMAGDILRYKNAD